MRRALVLLLMAGLAAPLAAQAQAWTNYAYPEQGFTIQFPAAPTVTPGSYRTTTGQQVPAVVYAAHQDGADFTITVADFSTVNVDEQAALADAVKAVSQAGDIKDDTQERIDRNFGHDISLAGRDGSRSAIAVFFVGRKLYRLEGKALPADAASHSGQIARFQQTLSFVDAQGRAPTRPEDGLGGPGGRGGRGGPGRGGPPGGPGRGPPPPSAFEDCKGKSAGDAVKHATPQGVIDATCVTSPQGLFARPNMPPPPAA